jgi:3-oxoacyl-ACP reductase-like protein
MMGYIKHFDGCLRWVDSKNDKPADDKDVRGRYKKEILTYASMCLQVNGGRDIFRLFYHYSKSGSSSP